MSIPIITFLFIYFFAIAIFLLGSIFILYHIIRFGFEKKLVYFSSGIFIILSIAILIVSAYYLIQVDWSQSINLTFGLNFF